VGGGTAGSIVAARLSELRQMNVLLLEAGGLEPVPETSVPLAWRKLSSGAMDWGFSSEPEPYLDKQVLAYPRGKVLGGCTAMYATIYSKGDRYDYDAWRELGNPGWGWDYVAPYFEKSLKFGLPLEPIRGVHPFSREFVEAGAGEGAHFYEVMLRQGRRVTAAQMFLSEARKRPNLTIRGGANVVRVIFEDGRACGVEVLLGGKLEVIRMRQEVVLCAGAIQTPAILMRSGIGPARHLEGVGIAPYVDLPGVGENLQEHVRAGQEFASAKHKQMSREPGLLEQMRYWMTGAGPLSSPGVEAGAYLKSYVEAPAPDLQLNFVPRRSGGNGFTIWTALLRPFSRGYLKLRSADPAEGPSIHLNVLEEREDRAVLEMGVQRALAIGEKMGQAAAGLRYDVMWHACGTCRMGMDGMGVVDSSLKVHEVQGLRIIDASIMPLIPSGNIAAPVMMVAERGADLIRC
jgi:choline dehydrogenase